MFQNYAISPHMHVYDNIAFGLRMRKLPVGRAWEALRRTRLTKPHYINLNIDYADFELVDTNIVDVLFRQAYRSNTYSDLTDKVLRMRKEGTDWKILLERSR